MHNFFISLTDKIELIDIINTFSIKKATGPHSIPSDIFHLIKLNVVEPLESIINLSFGKGIYIENLKITKTIPVFKGKGSPLDYNNYRPISLLSNINKLIEKLMHVSSNSFVLCPWMYLVFVLSTVLPSTCSLTNSDFMSCLEVIKG